MELQALLVKMKAKIVIEYTGFSQKPNCTIVNLNDNTYIGTLEWALEIFRAKQIYLKAVETAKTLESNDILLTNIAKVIDGIDSNFKPTAKHRSRTKFELIKKYIDKIENIQNRTEYYSKLFRENPLEGSNHVAVEHVLLCSKRIIGIMIEDSHRIITDSTFDVKEEIKTHKIPIWIYDHFVGKFNEEIMYTEDENGNEIFEGLLDKIYPRNFSKGIAFTSAEILDEVFLIKNEPLLNGNGRFISGALELIRSLDIPYSSKQKKVFERSISENEWHLKRPKEDMKDLLEYRQKGQGIKKNIIKYRPDLKGDEKIIDKGKAIMQSFDFYWNSIIRMQVEGRDPVSDFWEGVIPSSDWNLQNELSPFDIILKQKDYVEKCENFYYLKGGFYQEIFAPFLRAELKDVFGMKTVSLGCVISAGEISQTNFIKDLKKIKKKNNIDSKIYDAGKTKFSFPNEKQMKFARKLLPKKIVSTVERKKINWDIGIISELKEYKDYMELIKIDYTIKDWLELFDVSNEGIKIAAIETAREILQVAYEQKYKEREKDPIEKWDFTEYKEVEYKDYDIDAFW